MKNGPIITFSQNKALNLRNIRVFKILYFKIIPARTPTKNKSFVLISHSLHEKIKFRHQHKITKKELLMNQSIALRVIRVKSGFQRGHFLRKMQQ
jgi:hypothetical protein